MKTLTGNNILNLSSKKLVKEIIYFGDIVENYLKK